jgi:predicted double-glycine peptidase
MNRSTKLVLAISTVLCTALAAAATVEVRGPQDGGFATRITSLKEARFTTTLRQQYDFSCGSAAVATLLTHQYGLGVTEREVFTWMYAHGDQAKIRREGFSMLDMKHYLGWRGLEADGFQQPVERLFDEKLPAIVLLSERGYRHFVVVKGIQRDRVLIADPAMGTRTLSHERFRQLWSNGILFVIRNWRNAARFNLARDWRVAPAAPLSLAVDHEHLLDSLPARQVGTP